MAKERNWTTRGKPLTGEDKSIIGSISRQNMESSRIFVTGEVRDNVIGETAEHLLYASNDALTEPLFVQTKVGTVQMARFNPEVVWGCIEPKKVEQLVLMEKDRLGIDVPLDEWDFYASMVTGLRIQHGELSVPATKAVGLEDFYQAVYMACLWCFDKPGYMAVPIVQHFALEEAEKWVKNSFGIKPLKQSEVDELLMLREKYGSTQGITNHELNYLLKVCVVK